MLPSLIFYLVFSLLAVCVAVTRPEYEEIRFLSKFNDLTDAITSNIFLYDKHGHLLLSGETEKRSEDIKLFFVNGYTTNCTDASQIGNKIIIPHFEIEVCLGRGLKCVNGLSICYSPELVYGSGKVDKDYVLKDQRKDVRCGRGDRGIQISTDEQGKYFLVKVSIDKHIYKFPVPPLLEDEVNHCFKIRMGNKESLATDIVNTRYQKLIFTGDPPVHFSQGEDAFSYAEPQNTNFWQLFIDFMPKYNVGQDDFFWKNINYLGGGPKCKMLARLSGPGLTTCAIRHRKIAYCVGDKDTTVTCGFTYKEILQRGTDTTDTKETGSDKSHQNEAGIALKKQFDVPVIPEITLHYKHTWTYGSSERTQKAVRNNRLEIVESWFDYKATKAAGKAQDGIEINTYYFECMGYYYFLPIYGYIDETFKKDINKPIEENKEEDGQPADDKEKKVGQGDDGKGKKVGGSGDGKGKNVGQDEDGKGKNVG